MKKYKFFVLLLVSAIFISCEKEDVAIQKTTNIEKQNILTFKNAEEFNETMVKVNSMNEAQRKNWETEQGFESFGSICDKFYKTIKPEKFKSKDEVNSFVLDNIDKIQIYTDDTGEEYCEVQEFNNPARFLLNCDRMYLIGTTVYKEFGDRIISTDIYNFERLKNVTNIEAILSEPTFKLSEKHNINKISSANITEASGSATAKIGSETYKLSVSFDSYYYSGESRVAIKVRSFSRFLLIYWGMDAPVNINFSFKTTNSNNNILQNTFIRNQWVLSAGYEFLAGSVSATTSSQPYFLNYNCHVYNTITTDNGTCNCVVDLVY